MKPKYFLYAVFGLIIAGVILSGCTQQPKACIAEAKICPDGTSVGRSGPNCEFAPCPAAKNCTPEGESYAVVPEAKPCCEGLTVIGCDKPDASGNCPPACAGASYCTKCGDGICGKGENKCNCPQDCEEAIGMANPAAVYCIGLDYNYEIKTAADGSQYGICIFDDNSQCEEWAFYRGECGTQFSYCEKQGYKIENITEDMGTWTANGAVCVFDDNSECLEQKFFDGNCSKGDCIKFLIIVGCIASH